jgi:protein involved in polysaccharide export with SLBB domain
MIRWMHVPIARITGKGPRPAALSRAVMAGGALVALVAAPAVAQTTRLEGLPRRAAASRQELDDLAARAEGAAAAPNAQTEKTEALQRYAADLRARLRQGDFQAGDHILLAVRGDSTLNGTYTVQPSRVLVVPKLPPIPLAGVLRSELQPYIAARIRPYVLDTLVQGTPLVRIGVLGEVAHPGYYRAPLDATLGDALMLAGGPTPQADLKRTTIRRGDATVLEASGVRAAMMRGAPLGDLDVDAGDELLVLGKHERNWTMITSIGGLATGLILSLHSLRVF